MSTLAEWLEVCICQKDFLELYILIHLYRPTLGKEKENLGNAYKVMIFIKCYSKYFSLQDGFLLKEKMNNNEWFNI